MSRSKYVPKIDFRIDFPISDFLNTFKLASRYIAEARDKAGPILQGMFDAR